MARTIPEGEQGERMLKRRIVVGNLLSYTGMTIALVVFFGSGGAAPWLYGVGGALVGSGVGMSYFALMSLRRRRPAE
ncbi:hypothetical protein [Thiohalorhabdus methylotrophus]|uniref:Uncharacterized protein n=1 Tax=Thiohalorhabdus methylotrophus TaxID=3242694 RepID=A0ABV4TV94_9GAMM